MKILELDLRAFGPFTDTRLDLSGGQHGLHLIFGPNEAGKSSALRALRQLLFGIDARTTDRFLHDYGKLRIGATLRRSDGEELAFLRRKGNRSVLRSPDEAEILEDNALAPFLGGIDEARFEMLFSLDHERLLSGGKEILEGQGDAGLLIFGAGTDLSSLLKLRKKLDDQAKSLYRPRGENYPLNQSLAKFAEASKAIDAASIRSEAWEDHQQRKAEAEAEAQRIGAELDATRRQKARLERLQQALPDVALRAEVVATLESLKASPRLPDGFSDDRRSVEQALHDANRTIREAQTEQARLQAELEAIPAASPILAESALINSIKSRHEILLNEAATVANLRGESKALESSTQALRSQLGLHAGDEVPRVTIQLRERVRTLEADWNAIIFECESSSKNLDRLIRELEEQNQALEAMDEPRDTAPLRRVLKRVEQRGDPSIPLEEARRQASKLHRQAQAELKKLAPWSGSLDDLEALAVPSDEVIDTHEAACQESSRELEAVELRVREAEDELRLLTSEIKAKKQGRSVPSEEDLRAARARRDLHWRLIKAEWRGSDEDIEALRAFPSYASGDLAIAFERSLIEADALADQLRLEADRVSEFARLEADRVQTEESLAILRSDRDAAIVRRDEAEDAWRRLWSSLGFEPGAPREMRAWVRQQIRLVEKITEIHEAEALVAEHEMRVRALRSEISGLLQDLGEAPEGREVPLPDLLERAREVLGHHDELKNQRQTLEKDREKSSRQLEDARRKEVEDHRELADWRNVWTGVVEPLGIDPEAKPGEVRTVLEKREELASSLEKLDDHRRRITAFEEARERIESEARELAGRVLPELADEPLPALVEGLARRLTDAHRDEANRETRQASLETQQEREREGNRQIDDARLRLDELLRLAGCSEAPQLPEVEEQDRLRREAEARLQEVDDRLRNHSGGIPVAEFLEEAQAIDPDGLPGEILRLDQEIQANDAEHQTLIARIAEHRQNLRNMEESSKEARAIEAAHEAQELLARIEAEACRYARLRLAMAVLHQAIESYRKRSQGPILRRAETLFQQLTLNSFSGLTTDIDEEGTPRLLGVRPSGETVAVSGLSEGTRDQLYLALKLASLEHHLDHHEPLPFIADDLLVNFDDERAQAALRILAELSKRTQILFFTHHRHLAELAEATLKPDVLWTHELPAAGENGRLIQAATID